MMSTWVTPSGRLISSTLPRMTLCDFVTVSDDQRKAAHVIISSSPFARTMFSAFSAISLASTAYTFRAPDFAANKESMPVPHPTSSTVASLNKSGFFRIKDAYDDVRTLSWIITAWISEYPTFSTLPKKRVDAPHRLRHNSGSSASRHRGERPL